MVNLEGFAFKCPAIINLHFEGGNCLGDGIFIQIAGFGEVDGDTAVDIGSRNVVDFFQGHTGLFVGVCSSGAANPKDVCGLGDDSLSLSKGGKS